MWSSGSKRCFFLYFSEFWGKSALFENSALFEKSALFGENREFILGILGIEKYRPFFMSPTFVWSSSDWWVRAWGWGDVCLMLCLLCYLLCCDSCGLWWSLLLLTQTRWWPLFVNHNKRLIHFHKKIMGTLIWLKCHFVCERRICLFQVMSYTLVKWQCRNLIFVRR